MAEMPPVPHRAPLTDENGNTAPIWARWFERVRQLLQEGGAGGGGGGAVDSVNGQTGVVVLDKTHIGLSNVNNTADSSKPVSTAQAAAIAVVQADINAHEADTANPHAVTKAQVGLGSVDNTSDLGKPISTATQTALDLKAPLASPTFTGTVTADNIAADDITADAISAATLNTTGLTTVDSLLVNGATTLNDTVEVGNVATFNGGLNSLADISVSGGVAATGGVSGSTVTATGTVSAPNGVFSSTLRVDAATNSTLTGSAAVLTPTKPTMHLTNASLASLGGMSEEVGNIQVLINRTGAAISLLNENAGVTATRRIVTGTGADITLPNGSAVILHYTSADSRWHVVGVAGVTSVNGQTGAVTLAKGDVGLGNVDNTSDANKPISTATQTALDAKVPTSRTVNGHALSANVTITKANVGLGNVTDDAQLKIASNLSDLNSAATARTNLGLGTAATQASTAFAAAAHTHPQSDITNLTTDLAAKAPLASPALTGTPTAPTAVAGTNTTQIATTAFVSTAVSAVSGGSSSTNLITNSTAESGTTGWATYNDGTAAVVDGTGGVVSNITFAQSTTSPLAGTASFLLSRTAGALGRGVSVDFDISEAYKARVLQISFDYRVASGTFTAGTATTDSDVVIYVVDRTNGTVIQPTTFRLFSNSTTIATQFISNFQTASNSTAYRLCFHIPNGTTTAFGLQFDNVTVEPSKYVYGTPITDWQAYTPTGSWTTNTTYSGMYRRVGSDIEARFALSLAGAPNNANLTVNAPSGITLDTAKVATAGFGPIGYAEGGIAGAGYNMQVITSSSTAVNVIFPNATNDAQSQLSTTLPAVWGSGSTINGYYTMPVVGWVSNVQTSDLNSGREISASYERSTTQSFTSGTAATIIYDTRRYDYGGGMNTSNGRYTIIEAGRYSMQASFFWTAASFTAGNALQLRFVRRNAAGTAIEDKYKQNKTVEVTGTREYSMEAHHDFDCNAGDTLEVLAFQNAGAARTTIANINQVSYRKIAGPTTITATETVACRVQQTAQQTLTTATETKITNMGGVTFDTHGGWSTANNEYTFGASGVYEIMGGVSYGANATGVRVSYISVVKSGVSNLYAGSDRRAAISAGDNCENKMMHMDRFNAGDKVFLTGFQSSGAALATSLNYTGTFIQIKRIGL